MNLDAIRICGWLALASSKASLSSDRIVLGIVGTLLDPSGSEAGSAVSFLDFSRSIQVQNKAYVTQAFPYLNCHRCIFQCDTVPQRQNYTVGAFSGWKKPSHTSCTEQISKLVSNICSFDQWQLLSLRDPDLPIPLEFLRDVVPLLGLDNFSISERSV